MFMLGSLSHSDGPLESQCWAVRVSVGSLELQCFGQLRATVLGSLSHRVGQFASQCWAVRIKALGG